MTCNIQSTIYDKVLIKQTKNQYLRFCRSKNWLSKQNILLT